MAQAFDLEREPVAVRDRYGRHTFGQSLLLARRLVQGGVPVVQVNMGSVLNWDTHSDNFGRLKKKLLPPMDQGVAALLDDLEATGLLGDTMVLTIGEFGRSPRMGVNTSGNGISPDGRDHWPWCSFGLFAGGGVRGGQLIGKSDSIAAHPITPPYSLSDVGATVYHILGVDPDAEVRDRLGRPTQLNRGQVMRALFEGGEPSDRVADTCLHPPRKEPHHDLCSSTYDRHQPPRSNAGGLFRSAGPWAVRLAGVRFAGNAASFTKAEIGDPRLPHGRPQPSSICST